MSYWIAGIDVHKRMLAVVVADVSVDAKSTAQKRTPLRVRARGRRSPIQRSTRGTALGVAGIIIAFKVRGCSGLAPVTRARRDG
jgi:hypothetical protein